MTKQSGPVLTDLFKMRAVKAITIRGRDGGHSGRHMPIDPEIAENSTKEKEQGSVQRHLTQSDLTSLQLDQLSLICLD